VKPAREPPTSERFLSRWSRMKRARERDVATGDVADGAPPPATTPAHATSSPGQRGARTSEATSVATNSPAAPVAPRTASAVAPASDAHRDATPGTPEGARASNLPSVDSLTFESDYSPFFRQEVPDSLRRAAVKKLFADPHFNIMDGLDTYIDDYSKPDPIPPAMLAALNQARGFLAPDENAEAGGDRAGLISTTEEAPQSAAASPAGAAMGENEAGVAAAADTVAAEDAQPDHAAATARAHGDAVRDGVAAKHGVTPGRDAGSDVPPSDASLGASPSPSRT